jgi:hypothetical protein
MLASQTDPWLQVGDTVVDLDDLPEVDGPCEEMGHVAIPGVLHMGGNGPNWIERCDSCDLFPGDLHAAQALADHLSIGAVVWLLPNTESDTSDTRED